MKLSTKVAYNTIIQIISKVISTVLGLIAVAIFTRYLGQVGFGEYTAVMTFLTFFAIIADFGLTLVTVQMLSQPDVNREKMMGNLFGLRLVSAIIIIGSAPIIILLFPYSPAIKFGVLIAVMSLIFVALNQVFVGLFQKELRMDKVSIAEVVSRLFLFVGAIVVYKYDLGLNGVLVANVFSAGVGFALHYIFARQMVCIKPAFDWPVWIKIFHKSWPLAITIILNLVYLKTDILFLSLLPRESELGIIAETGLYGAAYKVIDVIVTLPFIFSGIVLPILTARWIEKNRDSFKNILQKSFEILMIFAVPLIIGTQFLAKDIIVLIAGADFIPAAPILQILILAAGFIFLGNAFAHAVIAIDQQKKTIPAYLFTAVTSVFAYLFFIKKYSYFGAAYVTVYSEMAIAIASVYYVWKYTGFKPSWLILLKTGAASLMMALMIMVLHHFHINNLLLILPCAFIVYFVSLYLVKGLAKEDVMVLLNK